MTEAVQRRLASTGLTAVTMSGGLDSTTVAALAQELAPRERSVVLNDDAGFPRRGRVLLRRADEGVHGHLREHISDPAAGHSSRPASSSLRARWLPAVTTTDFIRQPLYEAASGDGAGDRAGRRRRRRSVRDADGADRRPARSGASGVGRRPGAASPRDPGAPAAAPCAARRARDRLRHVQSSLPGGPRHAVRGPAGYAPAVAASRRRRDCCSRRATRRAGSAWPAPAGGLGSPTASLAITPASGCSMRCARA